MKYRKFADVVVPAGETITSPAIHIPPRYNDVENSVQRIDGSVAYDVLVQGLPAYPNPDEIYGGPTTVSLAQETDWIDIIEGLGIDPDHDFESEPSQYGYYRVKITAASDVTVRWECVGITGVENVTGVSGSGTTGATGPIGLPGLDGSGSGSGSGEDGATGATGPSGSAGSDGTPGIDGLNGLRGFMGPQGPQGDGDVAQLNLEMDDTEAGTLYVGESAPGSETSDAAWRIKRIVETGPDLSILWADGNADFDNVWDDRVNLTYD